MSHKKGGVIISPNESAIGPRTGGAGVYNGEKGYPGRSPGAGGPPEKIKDMNVGNPKPPSKQSY